MVEVVSIKLLIIAQNKDKIETTIETLLHSSFLSIKWGTWIFSFISVCFSIWKFQVIQHVSNPQQNIVTDLICRLNIFTELLFEIFYFVWNYKCSQAVQVFSFQYFKDFRIPTVMHIRKPYCLLYEHYKLFS